LRPSLPRQEYVVAKGVVMAIPRAILLTSLVVAVTYLIPTAAQAKARGTDRPISGIGLVTNTLNVQTQTFVAEGRAD
jgi:hypothetical protein